MPDDFLGGTWRETELSRCACLTLKGAENNLAELSVGTKRLVWWNFAVMCVWFSCRNRQNPSEKREEPILPTIGFKFRSERVATYSNPPLLLLRNRNLAFFICVCVCGGGYFLVHLWHLSVTCVRQFHSFIHAVCNYTVLLRDRFSLGPLYSLDVEEELVGHHL